MIDFLQTKAFPVPLNWCINLATCGKSSFHSGDIPNGALPCLTRYQRVKYSHFRSRKLFLTAGGNDDVARMPSPHISSTAQQCTKLSPSLCRGGREGTRTGAFPSAFSNSGKMSSSKGRMAERKNRFPPALLVCYTSNRVQDIYSQFLRMCTAYMFATSRWLWWLVEGGKTSIRTHIFLFLFYFLTS